MHDERRNFLLAMTGLLAVPKLALSNQLLSTPSQTAGPFYPVDLPLDNDNDLTRIANRTEQAKGDITDLAGRVVDINGNAIPNARIEIWQCDYNGRYRHPYEKGKNPIDANFQGHGFTKTNANGQYFFRTIKPVAYPGRTPHIHIAVFPPGEQPFVTQLYVKGEPENKTDFLFNHLPEDRKHLVLADFVRVEEKSISYQATFDIILDRDSGTPMDIS